MLDAINPTGRANYIPADALSLALWEHVGANVAIRFDKENGITYGEK